MTATVARVYWYTKAQGYGATAARAMQRVVIGRHEALNACAAEHAVKYAVAAATAARRYNECDAVCAAAGR